MLRLDPQVLMEHWSSMDSLSSSSTTRPRGPVPKPLLTPPLRTPPPKRLDLDLLTVLRKRKVDAGILPGVPFH
jgi:hypothetical protein